MSRGPPRWTIAFLRALERAGEVEAAARDAGIDKSTAYGRRKAHSDFALEWEEALERFRAAGERAREAELREVVGRLESAGHPLTPLAFGESPSSFALQCSDVPRTPCALRPAAGEGEDPSTAFGGPPPHPSGREELVVRPLAGGGAKLVRAGNGRWSKKAEEAFLVELAASGSARRAFAAAGFSSTTLYRRRLRDRHFAAAWDSALAVAKTRAQGYLAEAMTRTFDPDALPLGEEGPTVTIGEAIQIARLKAPGEDAGGFARKGGRDPFFDGAEEEAAEYEAAYDRLVDKLGRLCERSREEQAAKGWRLCEEADTMVPPGWARPEDMRVADGGPRSSARLHCPHCGGGLEVVDGGSSPSHPR